MNSDSAHINNIQKEIEDKSQFIDTIRQGMEKIIVGQKHLVNSLLIGLLADGHILLEGVPGLAKTLAIKTLSQLVDASFSRIQFTPDLLPSDIVGTQIFSRSSETFLTKKGPVFAHFILADEINRAPAKVQSALLEAMQERQVTIGEETHQLPSPFLVMATQNPIEQEGTYTLPEAQVDRFMLKVLIDYPTLEEEQQVVHKHLQGDFEKPQAIVDLRAIEKAREAVHKIYIDPKIISYIADIVFATRTPAKYGMPELVSSIAYGASPRASINLALASRAYAFIHHRGYVIPEDVRAICLEVLRHRLGLTYAAEANNLTREDIIKKILNKVQVP